MSLRDKEPTLIEQLAAQLFRDAADKATGPQVPSRSDWRRLAVICFDAAEAFGDEAIARAK